MDIKNNEILNVDYWYKDACGGRDGPERTARHVGFCK